MNTPADTIPSHYRKLLARLANGDVFAVTAPPRTPYADNPAARGHLRIPARDILAINEEARTLTYRDPNGLELTLQHFAFITGTNPIPADDRSEYAGCFGMLANWLRMISSESKETLIQGYDVLHSRDRIACPNLTVSLIGIRHQGSENWIARWENVCGMFPTDPLAETETVTIVTVDEAGKPSFIDINANIDWWAHLGF